MTQEQEGEQSLTVEVEEAIDCLDGHRILSVSSAQAVCFTLGVPQVDERLIMRWQTEEEAWKRFGFFATVAPGDGVDGLQLSYYVCYALGIANPSGRGYTGKGFQSDANAIDIRRALSERVAGTTS